jgi:mono/diheme cytochrome c family protein
MICAVFGAFVYVSSDAGRWRAFLGPIVRVLVLPVGASPLRRVLARALPPLIVGWIAWARLGPGVDAPAVIRVQHPGLPQQYAEMASPLGELAPRERDEAVREGTVLYQKNCRPCHGTTANGEGPLARGLRLRPIDFTDPGTIASVVEQYPFWRIEAGGPGLPDIATPWNSAMPAWGDELEPDEIWKIIAAEHRIAGTEPRRPEALER